MAFYILAIKMISRLKVTAPKPYQNYIDKAGEDDLQEAISTSTRKFKKLLKKIPKKTIDYAYAEGKWTIKELLQHIIDTERVFVLRALWFSRQDPSAQPGFDENIWAASAQVADRKWKDMVEEFFCLRGSTELFFASLNEEALLRTGTASGNLLSTAAMGFMCAGHINHHIAIIEEKYLQKPSKKKK